MCNVSDPGCQQDCRKYLIRAETSVVAGRIAIPDGLVAAVETASILSRRCSAEPQELFPPLGPAVRHTLVFSLLFL